MLIQRREVWWAELEVPRGSEPGSRRPLLIVQAEAFNRSRIRTVIGVVLTTNLRLLDAPGNVLVPPKESGLPHPSTANVSQVVTLDRRFLTRKSGRISPALMRQVESGLRLVLAL